MDEKLKAKLISAAVKGKENSYSPYSEFRVGAAVLTDRGEIFSGCNIENASYGATVCAERTAVFKAVSSGAGRIRAVAVTSDSDDFAPPCGICRQVISEFSDNAEIILVNSQGNQKCYTLEELLPFAFKL